VRRIALENGFKEVGEHDVWNIIWTDVPISLEKALEMRRFQNAHAIFWGTTPPVQKANHFPGMNEICRKDRLARNLNRMKKSFPEDYNFFPRTWSLPADVADLLMYSRLKKNATYICKPDSGCQGKGISLARNLKKLNPFAKLICQVYIPKPLLIDGYKFDLRIYILITSCDPLRVFIYNEGIARFATVKYSPPNDTNIDVIYMHLTNYSLNKFSQSYDTHGDGSKRKMSAVLKTLADNDFDVKKLQDSIDAVIVKTMIAAQPTLRHYYRASFPKHDHGSACFEILGFDILIDRSLKPFLLEVNHSPSFNLDLPVDAEIKESLLKDTFNIIYMGGNGPEEAKGGKKGAKGKGNQNGGPDMNTRLSKALQMQIHHENTHCGNYRLIYPLENSNNYCDFFDQTSCPTMADSNLSTKKKQGRYNATSKNSNHL
jgi:tubulin polyglutamylase TTLL6/13